MAELGSQQIVGFSPAVNDFDSRYQFQIKEHNIRVNNFDRALIFYKEALGFQAWLEEYPLPTNHEAIYFNGFDPPGYFVQLADPGSVCLIIPGIRQCSGFPRAIYVEDIEETKAKIQAAGGEILQYVVSMWQRVRY